MRNLKKHLEKIYRKSAFKLVQQGAKLVAVEPAAQASADSNDSGSPGDSAADSSTSSSHVDPSSSDSSTTAKSSTSSSNSSGSTSSVCEVVYEGDPIVISDSDLKDYVGLPPFAQDKFYDTTPVGVVMGLAWTAMGGATLYVEAAPIIEVSRDATIFCQLCSTRHLSCQRAV